MKRILFAGAAAAALISAPVFAQQVAEPPLETGSSVEAGAEPAPSASTESEWVAQSNSGNAVEAPARSGQLTVEGVTPAQALSAVDPSKLSDAELNGSRPDQTAAAEAAAAEAPVVSAEAAPDEEGVTPNLSASAEAPSDDAEAAVLAEATPQSEEATPQSEAAQPAGEKPVQLASMTVTLPQEVAEVVEEGSYSTDDLVAAQLAAIMDAGDQIAEVEPGVGSEPVIPPG